MLNTNTSYAETSIIVNDELTHGQISRALLRGIFGMRVRVWPDGTPIKVFVLEDDSRIHGEFCRTVLQTFPYQLRQNWDRLVYSGTGQPPTPVRDVAEMSARVAALPGAVGYIPASADPPTPGVKVIHVE